MSPERIRRAAEILRDRARELKDDGHLSFEAMIYGAYQNRDRHDEMLALAIELDVLAKERAR